MSYLPPILFVALVLMAASSGAIFKPGDWYKSLQKPAWTPPDWMFPVVWTALYIMIGIAGWLIWDIQGFGLVLGLWAVQLIFNAMWSWLFFGMRRMDYAFVDVTFMWLSIAAFIVLAWQISPWASLLFVPYLVWTTIAAALNLTVWRMNPDAVAA